MKKGFFYILGFFVVFIQNIAAQVPKHDILWPFGSIEPGYHYGNALLKFGQDSFEVIKTPLGMSFEASVAVGTSASGNLLFYSNGCEVRNASGELLANGDGLNPGDLSNQMCGKYGYPMMSSMATLPYHQNEKKWILLHFGGTYHYDRKLKYTNLYYSIVDMSANNGKGAVTIKNQILLTSDLEPFTITRHGNGRDWWLICPEYGTNIYHKWLFTPNGILSMPFEAIGESLACSHLGSSVFSPDGSHYARAQSCGVQVLQFDRCSGAFSNPILLPKPIKTLSGGGGVVFSKDNKWLYSTSTLSIYRANLEETNPFLDSLFKREYFIDSTLYVHNTSLAHMQIGPNGVVYMNSRHQEKYYMSIELTQDTFIYLMNGARTGVNTVRTLPMFPNYNLYDLPHAICDTLGINTPITDIKNPTESECIQIHPNPARDACELKINCPELGAVSFRMINQLGINVYQQHLVIGKDFHQIDTQAIPEGVYYLEFYTPEKILASHKLVIVK